MKEIIDKLDSIIIKKKNPNVYIGKDRVTRTRRPTLEWEKTLTKHTSDLERCLKYTKDF